MTKRRLASFFLVVVLLLAPAWSAAEPSPLLVRVVDGDGRPLAGVTVRAAAEPEEGGDRETVLREETAADGTVRLSGLTDDRIVWIVAERKGFSPALRSFSGASDARRELRIILDPGTLAVGQVVDEEGRPVADAEVELSGNPFGLEAWDLPPVLADHAKIRVRTGPAGRFRLRDLAAGSFEMTIKHPDAAPLIVERPIEGGTSGRLGTFVLRRGTTLHGTVTGPAGRPVPGARIWVIDPTAEWKGSFPEASAVTADDGTFSVHRQMPGREAFLWICVSGFLEEGGTIPFPEEPVQFALRPAAMAHGRVVGPDGAPVAGAVIRAEAVRAWTGCGTRVASPCADDEPVTADADGRFAFERITPGWVELVATAPGFLAGASEPLGLEAGEAGEEQEIRLHAGATLSGRVLDPSGAPVAGAQLRTWTEREAFQATSGADGRFRLTGLPMDTIKLIVEAKGRERAKVDVEMTSGEVATEIVLDPEEDEEPPIELYGKVLGPDGAPVEGASVEVSGHRVSSAQDGSFAVRICGCRSDKPVEILAEKRGFARGRTTVLLTGERLDGVVVRLEAGTLVSGRILGLADRDLSGATVILSAPQGQDSGGALGAPVRPDADGRFRLGPIPAGAWEIQAISGERSAQANLILEPGQAEASVEMIFAPRQEVRGLVLGPDDQPVAHAQIYAFDGSEAGFVAWTHLDGTFSLQASAGTLELTLHHGDLRGRWSFQVDDAPVEGLELRLERGIVVQGRWLGLPPEGMPVISLEGPFSWAGTAGPDGSWFAEGITPGRWTVEALSFQVGGVRTLRRTFDVSPDHLEELTLDLDFTGIPLVDPKILEEER